MPHHPSRRLESVLSALLPPAWREHVLGDLSECAETRGQYIGVFLAILPKVVLSATRRTLRWGTGVGLMAALSAVALAIAALVTRGPVLPEMEWLRWVAPWTVWVTGCALAAAYGAAGTRFWSGPGVLMSLLLAIATAALSGAHARGTAAALVVATMAHMALTLPKLLPDIRSAVRAATPPLTMDTIHERARHFQRMIWWRNARESVVGFALLGVNANTLANLSFDAPALWVPPALGFAGLACLLYVLHAKAGSRRVPEGDGRAVLRFHQAEIERQRDILRLVPYWYLLPLAPSLVAGAIVKWHPIAGPLSLAFMALVFYGIGWLNRAGAKWLDRQLEQARTLDQSCV
jgi:hypothetical protein